jgi:hypothetical protein
MKDARKQDRPSLGDLAEGMRRIHLQMLSSAMGATETAGSCLYASVLLSQALSQFGGCTAQVCGGGLEDETGYFDGHDWQPHFWVEAKDYSGKEWLVDITADQFGAAPVVVLSLAQARTTYRTVSAEKVRAHIQAMVRSGHLPELG